MRWTRIHTGTVALLALAFAAVALVKHGPGWSPTADTDTTTSTPDRAEATAFWQNYRHATEHRTAGRMDSAAASYRSALNRRSTHHDALYYLGQVLYTQNELQAARDTWQRLAETNPESARAFTQLGEVHFCFPDRSVFDLDQAQNAYKTALDLHNEETRPLLRLGTIAVLREDWPAARNHLEALRGANPNNPAGALLSGYLEWRDGSSARATVLLRKGQNRYAARDSTGRPECPLAERITTSTVRAGEPSPSSTSSPYAQLDRVLGEIRTERSIVDS